MARTKRKVNFLSAAPIKPKEEKIYRTGGYARLSVEDGGREGADTIKTQEEMILHYIEAQPDMEFAGMYSDNGKSGTDFHRPEFERLLGDVKSGKINCIAVKDLSRFGRNYLEAGNYLERLFPLLGVRFVAVAEGFDSLTAGKDEEGYLIPLRNMMNEFYSRDISRKIGSALALRQQRGEFIGTWAPYGYRKCADNPRRIEPDPETAPVVREIFDLYASGAAYQKIAEELNRREIPSPARYRYQKGEAKARRYAEAVWKPPTIKNILSGEVYLGHMVQGRRRQSFYEGKGWQRIPQKEWVIVRGTHEALVDEGIFKRAQERMEKGKRSGNVSEP